MPLDYSLWSPPSKTSFRKDHDVIVPIEITIVIKFHGIPGASPLHSHDIPMMFSVKNPIKSH